MSDFITLLREAEQTLAKEGTGKGYRREGSLLILEPSPVVIIGDIHGDLRALREILVESEIEEKIGQGWKLICLGDYADRGPSQVEVYSTLLELKITYPNGVFLIKGNHEATDVATFQPHDLPLHISSFYPNNWREIYANVLRIQKLMPVAAIIEGWLLLLHGGLFPELDMKKLISPSKEEMKLILWSDPSESSAKVSPSSRGAGIRFNGEVTMEVLRNLDVKSLVRSHQVVPEGFRFNHRGMVLTIISAKNVFELEKGAYLSVKPFEPLASCIRQF